MSTTSGDCPPWCVTDHIGEASTTHRAAGVTVPVIVKDDSGTARGRDFFVEMYAEGDGQPWFYVGDGFAQRFDAELSSARRLLVAVNAYIRAQAGVPREE